MNEAVSKTGIGEPVGSEAEACPELVEGRQRSVVGSNLGCGCGSASQLVGKFRKIVGQLNRLLGGFKL